jgi:hypothetical protein
MEHADPVFKQCQLHSNPAVSTPSCLHVLIPLPRAAHSLYLLYQRSGDGLAVLPAEVDLAVVVQTQVEQAVLLARLVAVLRASRAALELRTQRQLCM